MTAETSETTSTVKQNRGGLEGVVAATTALSKVEGTAGRLIYRGYNIHDLARTTIDLHPPTLGQVILTDFLDEGHFGRHIRRMRELYTGRQAALVSAVEQELKGLLEVSSNEAGMYLIGWLLRDQDDQSASEVAAAYGIEAPPLSTFRIEPGNSKGLLLGYTAFSEDEIRIGVQRLAEALRSMM